MKKINLNFLDKNIEVFYKKVKYMRIKISQNGEIIVSVPISSSEKQIKTMLNHHEAWINDCLKKIKFTRLKDGEIWLFGRIFRVNFDENIKFTRLNLGGKEFEFIKNKFDTKNFIAMLDKPDELRENLDEITVQDAVFLEKFKVEIFKNLTKFLVREFELLTASKVAHVSLNNAKTRWGSCNTHKGRINLSKRLLSRKIGEIRYVVLHEIAHLTHPNHSAQFYKYVENFMSDYKERELSLRAAL